MELFPLSEDEQNKTPREGKEENTWGRSGTRVVEGHFEEKEEEDGRGEPDQRDSGRVSRENWSPSHGS